MRQRRWGQAVILAGGLTLAAGIWLAWGWAGLLVLVGLGLAWVGLQVFDRAQY